MMIDLLVSSSWKLSIVEFTILMILQSTLFKEPSDFDEKLIGILSLTSTSGPGTVLLQ